MKLQIIKIFSFWAVFTFIVHTLIQNYESTPADVSNIQLKKPVVTKVKTKKSIGIGQEQVLKGKKFALK